ncbi:hypothetical protein GGH94_001844 [Coemansia aciculifera]|uniref:Uncharacterized protein n=1 Tax=Coemansia aciculifera TaxID=417176 RepID=A0A9W8IN36_9FUNG|nr:hypothetical protein GGH94_001844 [Coemansia aciculifera]KAJ2877250.1 hypothetical protein GGH93_000134 [Coemansia aciculifera]
MTRSKLSFLAAAWLLAAYQVEAGPIATAADNAATSSELASLGGLLQALGAGVIGNGALLYPTAASSHQRAEAEILASDTATRVFKKVKSILKEGGINDDEDGGEESAKSVTYLVKPALIFHKEELPPPNPLAGNVLPLPGGALLYTPTPTAGANGEATSGPAASIKAAYGNLFAASPYTPSYTLNKPHAAVIVEEVTDMLSLKSMQQRLEDAGEDDEEEDEEEDEYGRKKKGKKNVKFVSLETIDSTSAFINPFTRADFPFGLMTPPAVPTQSKKESEEPKTSTRKTIKKMLSAKPTSTAASSTSAQINASLGKDGGITIVANNLAQATSSTVAPGTTIIIPPASLTSSASNASSASSSASPASSSVSIHEDSSRNDDVKANEVGRMAHTSPAMPDMGDGTSVKGNRRDAATCDPLASSGMSSMSGITDLAQATNMRDAMESPVGTVGSSTEWHAESSATQASASEVPKHRKMHIVRVFEVKKNKSSLISGSSSSAQSSSSSGEHIQKRDIMPLYDSPESTSMLEANPMDTPMLAETYSTELIAPNTYPPNTYPEPARMAPTVSNWQRMIKESANDNDSESDSDDEQGSKKLDSDAEKVRDILSMSKDNVSPTATDASASSSSASVESTGTASAESSSASVESSSASVESTGTASAESSSASVNSSSVSAESSSASVESSSVSAESTGTASVESSSVSGDVKVEAASASTSASGNSASASTSASGDSASASSSAQSTKATAQSTSSVSAQSTSSVSAQSSSATAHSTSSVSAKKSGTAMTSSTSHAANSSSRSLSIEDIGAQETSVEKGSASEEAESDKKSESDSDSDSEGESGVEKHNADERDASEEGDSESSDNESEIAKNEDSDDEEASPRTKVGSKERLAIVPIGTEGDSLMAIQRVAALGLREAEKAVEEFEKHSDAPEIEALTTQDEKPAMTSSASELAATQSIAAAEALASRSVASALSVAMSSLGQRASESASQSPVRAAAHKDRDDDSDDDKDDDDEKDEKRSKKEDSDDDDEDSDNDKGKSANSDDDTDDDSDSGSDKKSRRKKSGDGKQARGEFDKEANAARKAVSDAAAESAQQAVKATATELDAMATDSASADGDKAERRALSEAASESIQQAVKVTATELDNAAATDSAMTDGSAVGRDVASASEDDMEFETNKGVNSDGEEVQFVTQLVADERQDKAERAKVNESPSIVVMASIDEEYEEDYYTKPHASGARRSAHASDNASDAIVPSRVQRNAVHAMNDVDDVYDEGDKVVRGVEPTPDLSIIKESQNRAINIGLGNLRRHV